MSVTRRKFGKTKDGEPVTLYTITNKMGNSVSIMDYGATVPVSYTHLDVYKRQPFL